MEVAPQRIDCNHPMMPDYKCLQVRDIRYDDSGVKQPPGEWEAFYGDIEGFEFRAGERKVLRLKNFDRPDPVPAVASSLAYVPSMVVVSEARTRLVKGRSVDGCVDTGGSSLC